jgi:tetratricopeptide (TPR) repeat protein
MSDNDIQTRKKAIGSPKPGGCSPFAWLRRLALFRWIDANFSKLIAVSVALVTVFAGIVAFLESWASSRYGTDVRQSQALAMDALGYDMSSRQRENYDFYLYTTWNEWDWRRIRAGDDEALAERSRHVADMVSPLTPLLDESEPYFDPETQLADFSTYHVDTNLITTTVLLEQRGFAIETASIWNGKADGYVTILTLLSVALFLFGLSITIRGGLRYLFTAVGGFLVSVSLLWALILTLIPVPAVPDEAIAEYARGVGLSYLGYYEVAGEAFDAALQAYPRYGNAYHERGKIYLRSGDYTAAVADFEQAVENGREDPSTYWEMGWAYYLLGDYESALEANGCALDLAPDLLPVVMNVGTALLADGQTEAAMAQYERGLAMVADPDASIPASWSHLYLRLTVTDLDNLIAALDGWTGFAEEPDLSRVKDRAALKAAAEAARLRIKEGLVAIEAAGVSQMEPTGATLSPLVFARNVGLDGGLVGQGDTFARGALSVVATLSCEDLSQGAVVSRRVARQWADDPGAVEYLPTMGADIPWNGESGGSMQHVLRAPWPGDRGLRPGKYIVEYYVDSHLLQTGSFTVPDEDTLVFSPIVFATEYASGGIPYDPADLFPAGVAEVNALINYSGVPEGSIVRVEWYRDGELYYSQQTSAISGWGNHSFFISDVPAGTYRFDLSVEGQGEVLQSASFEVLEVGDYLQAIGGELDDSLFHRNLGDAYAYAGDYQAAADSYGSAAELDPQCGKCYYRWWSLLYDQAKYQEAIEKLEKAIELRPKEYEYVSDLGRTYYQLGEDEKAAAAYREAISANPASVYNRWGNAFFDLERYEESAMKYQQSLELNPDDAVVHANLGGAYRMLGEYDKAVAEFQEAAWLDPGYAWAYNRWGDTLYDQEQYAEAAEKYLEAATLAPAESLYYSNLGWAYFKLGWYEEAGNAFGYAVGLGPSASDCNMWGRALYELGQYLEAAEKHLWAIDLNPDEPLYHYNLGWDYYQLQEWDNATAEFEKAAELAALQGDEDMLQDAQDALEALR